jgi:hypothetical protein
MALTIQCTLSQADCGHHAVASAGKDRTAGCFRCSECQSVFQTSSKRNRHEYWCLRGETECRLSKIHFEFEPLAKLAIAGCDLGKVLVIGGSSFEALADRWCNENTAVSRRGNHLAHVRALLTQTLAGTHHVTGERKHEDGRTRSFIRIVPK